MTTTWVINMLSGPGSGKSTLAAELFVEMKKQGYKVEYLQEYAKKLVWQKNFDMLNNQHLVSYKYFQSILAMKGCVDFIILDSSLLNGLWYNRNNPDNLSNIGKTEDLIIRYYQEFNNINFFIHRGNYQYENAGRIQTESEAIKIDNQLMEILNEKGIEYYPVNMSEANIIHRILETIRYGQEHIERKRAKKM